MERIKRMAQAVDACGYGELMLAGIQVIFIIACISILSFGFCL